MDFNLERRADEIHGTLDVLQRSDVASGPVSERAGGHAEHFSSEGSEGFLSLNPSQTSKGSLAGAVAFRYPASWLFRSLTWEKSSMMQCNISGPNMFLAVCANNKFPPPRKSFL